MQLRDLLSRRACPLASILVAGCLALGAPTGAWGQESAQTGAPNAAQASPAESDEAKQAAPAEHVGKYLRVVEDEKGVLTLELATRSFRRADGTGPEIHLVGAVHIGDKSFYEARQAELDKNDLVLFEGVKSSGMSPIDPALDDAAKAEATRSRLRFLARLAVDARERTGAFAKDLAALAGDAGRFKTLVESLGSDGWGKPLAVELVEIPASEGKPAKQAMRFTSTGSDGVAGGEASAADIVVESDPVRVDAAAKAPAGNIQSALAKALGVAFQLDEMDSTKANWRNSDIDVETLRTLLDEAGPQASMVLKMLDGNSLQAKLAGLLLSFVGVSKTLSTTVKVVMVDQLAQAEELFGGMKGMEAMQRVIIEDRNRIVLDDLKRIVASETDKKSIAVFYGAGHMASMERCLTAELELVPTGETWLPAMRVDPAEAGMGKAEVKRMRGWMRGVMRKQLGN